MVREEYMTNYETRAVDDDDDDDDVAEVDASEAVSSS